VNSLPRAEPIVCATYERVSTHVQARAGYSLGIQAESLEAYAAQQGWLLPDDLRFRDVDSGADWDLPGLQAMLAAARERRFKVLLVWDLDRFARSLVKALVLEEELKKHGVAVFYLRVPTDDTPEGKLLKHQLFSFAEYEREKIGLRLSLGRRARAERGKVVPGRTPYGYRYDPEAGTFVIDPIEAEVVRKIYEAVGFERLSTYQVAKQLTELGAPTPGQKHRLTGTYSYRGLWHPNAVSAIIRNPTYRGDWYYGKTRQWQVDGRHYKQRRPLGTAVRVAIPGIVSPELWRLANEALDQGRARAPRNAKYTYLLRGLIRCACGRLLVGTCRAQRRKSGRTVVYRWYACMSGRRWSSRLSECPVRPYINADQLEDAVWRAVVSLLTEPETLEEILLHEAQRRERQRAQLHERLEAAQRARAEIEAQLRRLLELDLVGYPSAIIEQKRRELTVQYQEVEATCTRLEHELAELPPVEMLLPAVSALREELLLGSSEATPHEKRRVLELLNARVHVQGDGSLTLSCSLTDCARLTVFNRVPEIS